MFPKPSACWCLSVKEGGLNHSKCFVNEILIRKKTQMNTDKGHR